MSHYIIAVIVIGQVLMINYGGEWCQTTPLSMNQWWTNIGIGSMSLPVGLLLRLFNRDGSSKRRVNIASEAKKDF